MSSCEPEQGSLSISILVSSRTGGVGRVFIGSDSVGRCGIGAVFVQGT